MKKLRKILLIAIPIALLLGVVVLVVLYLSMGTIVKTGIETVGSKIAGVEITVENVSLSPLSGKGEIKGLVIGNPDGFKTDAAFKLGLTRVAVDLGSIFSDTIVIREITIEAPEITYEMSLSGSNVHALQKNVETFAGTDQSGTEAKPEQTAEPEKEPESATEDGKKVVIESFVLTDAEIRLSATLLGGKAVTVPLPEVRLNDIGKQSDGKGVAEVVEEVFGAIAGSVKDAVTGSGKLLGDGTEKLKDSLEDAGKGAKEGASKAIEGVKGLFKKK